LIKPELITKHLRSLEQRIEDISVSVTSGSASNYEHYKAMVGEIQGLSYAIDDLRTLLKRHLDDE
jgi:hypothetical protein